MPEFDLDTALATAGGLHSLCCDEPLVCEGPDGSSTGEGNLIVHAQCNRCNCAHKVPFRFLENRSTNPDFNHAGPNYEGCPVCQAGLDLGNGGTVKSHGFCSNTGDMEDAPMVDVVWFEMSCPDCGRYQEVYQVNGAPTYA